MDNKEVKIVISAVDHASAVIKGVASEMRTLGSNAKQFIGTATAQAAQIAKVGLLGLAGVVAYSTKEYAAHQTAIAQTNAVLKSTGGVAGVTAKKVTELADHFEGLTKFSDDQVRSTENLLLTFTAINKKIFPDATKVTLDMAQALGEDTKSAAIQLGKALQDPILGATALRRVGVNLDKQQQETIKRLVDTGQKAKAQALIMHELKTEFGGSAEAAGKTFGGQLIILKNRLSDVGRDAIGPLMANFITPLAVKLADLASHLDFNKVIDNAKQKFKEFADKLKPVLDPIKEFVSKHSKTFIQFLKDFAIAGAIVIPVLAGIGAVLAVITSPLFLISLAVAGLIFIWQKWHQEIERFWHSTLQPVVNFLVGMFMPSLHALAETILTRLWPAIKNLWNALNPALMTALKIVAGIVAGAFIGAIWLAINVLNVVISVISAVIRFISNLIRWVGNAVGAFFHFIGAVGGVMERLPGTIVHAVGNLGGLLYNAGKAVIQGLINGIDNMAGAVEQKVKNVANGIKDVAKKILHIFSPSQVMADIGENVSLGMAQGIDKGSSSVMKSASTMAQMPINAAQNVPAQAGGIGTQVNSTDMSRSSQVTIQQVVLSSSDAVKEFFGQLDKDNILVSKGLTTARGM